MRENGDGRRWRTPGRAEHGVREREAGHGVEVRQVGKAGAADDGNVDGAFMKRLSAS